MGVCAWAHAYPIRLSYDTAIAVRRHRSDRNARMARVDPLGAARAGTAACPVPAGKAGGFHSPLRHVFAVQAEHGLPEYDFQGTRTRLSGRPLAGAAQRRLYPLECPRHGGAGQSQEFRVWRPYRDVRLGGDAVRGGLQSFLASEERSASRRYDFHAGAFGPRYLRACVSRRSFGRKSVAAVSPGGARRRIVVLSTPVADAGVLAIPHRVDGF